VTVRGDDDRTFRLTIPYNRIIQIDTRRCWPEWACKAAVRDENRRKSPRLTMNIPNGKFRSLHATLALTCLGVIVAQYPGYAQDAANSSSQSSVSRLFIYYEQTDTSNGPPGRPISDTNLVARLANTTWGGPSMPKVPGKQNWFTLNPDMTVRRGWSGMALS
jgi:hypothetical protein